MKTQHVSAVGKYIGAWIALPFIAVFNGVLRDLTYEHVFGDHVAHQISAIILSLIIAFYVVALNSKISLRNAGEAIQVGLAWLLLTVAFESILGIVMGISLREQLASYNILRGELWVVVLLTVTLAPGLLRRFRIPGAA